MYNAIIYEVGKTYKGKGEVKNVDFTLLKREGDLCLFERSDRCYEIIELHHQKESSRKIGDKIINYQAKEIYPSGNAWDGLAITKKEDAESRFEQMVKSQRNYLKH